MRSALLLSFAMLLLAPSANAQVSYWSFDNPGNPGQDQTGGSHGTLYNSPAWTPNGLINGAVLFDGMDDYIDFGNHSSLGMGTGNFSVSFWFRKGEAGDKYESILYKATPRTVSPGYGFLLRETGGELKFTIGDGTSTVEARGPGITDTKWHHAVGVRGGGRVRLYLDSSLAAEAGDTAGSVGNAEKLVLGMGGYGNNPGGPYAALHFRGTVDELRVYSSALTPQQVGQLYQSGLASHREPPAVSLNSPVHGQKDVPSPAILNVTVRDVDGDTMNVRFFGSSGLPSGTRDNFTIIAIPDTQYYSESYPSIFNSQVQWIVNNRDSLNIVFVTHLGDIVENWDNALQWSRANQSMSLLDGVVPWGIAPGNHDQETPGPFPHNAYYYNQYFNYTRFLGYGWYGGHNGSNNDNSYQLFSAGGLDFIIIHLEYNPSNSTLDWANQVLSSKPGRRAIVTSHYIIRTDGRRIAGEAGDRIFNALKHNPGLFLMLCGHDPGEGRRTDVVYNRTIHTLLSDYQNTDSRQSGYLRIMTFSPKDNRIYVKTYSPYLNSYMVDSDSQFTLNYSMVEYREIGSILGVGNGSYTATWPGLNANTVYHWYASAVDSNSQVSMPEAWSFLSGISGSEAVPGDLDDDKDVDINDLIVVTRDFGKTSGFDPKANPIQDGEIDIFDVVYVASRFGHLEIYITPSPGSGGIDTFVGIPVQVRQTTQEIVTFGLDLVFNASVFQFQGVSKGNLTADWYAVDGNEISPGTVRIGGFPGSGTRVPAGSTGTLVVANLLVTCPGCANMQHGNVCIQSYVDSIAVMTPQPSCTTFNYTG